MTERQGFHIEDAFSFYEQFILKYSQDKAQIYERYGFTLQGSIGSKDWEVLAAILLGDRARDGDGADLMNYEVKSAVIGNSFEYQYHKNSGIEKLNMDKLVDHVFISRNETYTDVSVWLVDRVHLISIFDDWRPELEANYDSTTRQRFRKSVSHGFVRQHGQKIFSISEGRLETAIELE
jgi:hypothetical protein